MKENVKIVGRIVWGHPLKAQKKRHLDGPQKGQIVKKDDGTDAMQWAYGVAVPKEATLRQMYAGNPQIEQIVASQAFERTVYPSFYAEAATGYPSGTPPKFSWKFQDGDGIDSEGKPYNQREGYAGHYVVTIATEAFAPPVYKKNAQTGAWDQLTDSQIKTGDYVAVDTSIQVNVPKERTHTPSLYVNPRGVNLIGYGTEIISRGVVDPNQAFGDQQYMLPPGASMTPIAAPGNTAPPQMPQPGQPGMPPAPGMPAPPVPVTSGVPGMMPGQPQPGQVPGMMPPAQPGLAAPPAPAHDFVHAGAPPMQPGMQLIAPGMPPQPGLAAPQMAMPGQVPGMMPPAPVAPPPPAVPAVQRPTDPSHIHAAGTAGEMWWINGAWTAPPR